MPSPTVSYSIEPLVTKALSPGVISYDIVGLSNGGFAALWNAGGTNGGPNDAQDVAAVYDLHDNPAGSNFTGLGQDGADAQLTNGNVVSVWQHTHSQAPTTGDGIFYHIEGAGSIAVASGTINPGGGEFNPDVAALAGGGFVVVDQAVFSTTDYDIVVHQRSASGGTVRDFSIDTSSALDSDASVAGLADGGFAVAWHRVANDGSTAIWVAVYNADGTVRAAPAQIDPNFLLGGTGTINRDVNVTALKSGGFAISYEDNGWDSSQTDITVATFTKNGAFQHTIQASSLSEDDSQATLTTLSDGFVVTTFTNNFFGDLDVRATLIDPTTGTTISDPAHPFQIAYTDEDETDASVSALPTFAQFVIEYTNTTAGTIELATYQLVRTTIGTSAGDVITGDEAADVINGGHGVDILTGGKNGDTFTFDTAALSDVNTSGVFDRITDYDHADMGTYFPQEGDQVDLSAILSTAYNHGSGQAVSSLVRATTDGTGATLQVDTDGTGTAAHWITIAYLDGIHTGDLINVILDPSLPAGTSIAAATQNLPPSGTSTLGAFGTSNPAGGWTDENTFPRELADVNGDGMADIVGFGIGGVTVSLSTGGGHFATPATVISAFGTSNPAGGWTDENTYPRELADVNGDGMADIVGFGIGGVTVALATGGGNFATPATVLSAFGTSNAAGGWTDDNTYPRELADVNGDGMADIVGFGIGGVTVALATGGGHFATPATVLSAFGTSNPAGGWTDENTFPRELADINGDGMADIIGFGIGGVTVALATGGGHFATPTFVGAAFGSSNPAGGWTNETTFPRELADINGDGIADIVGFGIGGVSVSPAHDFILT